MSRQGAVCRLFFRHLCVVEAWVTSGHKPSSYGVSFPVGHSALHTQRVNIGETHMDDETWRKLLETARRGLGSGRSQSWASDSWCAWTTFSSLEHWLTYWACGLPEADELLATGTADGGTWTQSFTYSDLAHLIIPARFYWETSTPDAGFQSGYKSQAIEKLSQELSRLEIPHRLSERVLEIKLY
jgi:hypothetical protein